MGDRFGISKRQAKLACDFLREKGLINIEFRTIVVNDKKLNNVMYIEPVASELRRITGIDRVIGKDDPVTTECNRVLQQNVRQIQRLLQRLLQIKTLVWMSLMTKQKNYSITGID